MGKQIQHKLSIEDEFKLIQFMEEKFSVKVVDKHYPKDWDKQSLTRSNDASSWIILDSRVETLVIESANQIINETIDLHQQWQIRSKSKSCIEWNRDLYDSETVPSEGRFYLCTREDSFYYQIKEQTEKDIEKQFRSLTSWIKKNTKKETSDGIVIWESIKP